jgi:hypothetical protein
MRQEAGRQRRAVIPGVPAVKESRRGARGVASGDTHVPVRGQTRRRGYRAAQLLTSRIGPGLSLRRRGDHGGRVHADPDCHLVKTLLSTLLASPAALSRLAWITLRLTLSGLNAKGDERA